MDDPKFPDKVPDLDPLDETDVADDPQPSEDITDDLVEDDQ